MLTCCFLPQERPQKQKGVYALCKNYYECTCQRASRAVPSYGRYGRVDGATSASKHPLGARSAEANTSEKMVDLTSVEQAAAKEEAQAAEKLDAMDDLDISIKCTGTPPFPSVYAHQGTQPVVKLDKHHG